MPGLLDFNKIQQPMNPDLLDAISRDGPNQGQVLLLILTQEIAVVLLMWSCWTKRFLKRWIYNGRNYCAQLGLVALHPRAKASYIISLLTVFQNWQP